MGNDSLPICGPFLLPIHGGILFIAHSLGIFMAHLRAFLLSLPIQGPWRVYCCCCVYNVGHLRKASLSRGPEPGPCGMVVKERVDGLYRGEFAALFNEAAAAEMAGPRGGQVDQVRRAVELAHLGT